GEVDAARVDQALADAAPLAGRPPREGALRDLDDVVAAVEIEAAALDRVGVDEGSAGPAGPRPGEDLEARRAVGAVVGHLTHELHAVAWLGDLVEDGEGLRGDLDRRVGLALAVVDAA